MACEKLTASRRYSRGGSSNIGFDIGFLYVLFCPGCGSLLIHQQIVRGTKIVAKTFAHALALEHVKNALLSPDIVPTLIDCELRLFERLIEPSLG
jgi:hypothetical protein